MSFLWVSNCIQGEIYQNEMVEHVVATTIANHTEGVLKLQALCSTNQR